MTFERTFLKYSRSTSKGRDTYGYTIIKLTDVKTGRTFRTCGGGYDMLGAVLATWMQNVLQDELMAYLRSKGVHDGEYISSGEQAYKTGKPYGSGIFAPKGKREALAHHDGACGNTEELLRAMGYSVTASYGKRQNFLGYFVSKDEA